MDAADPGRSPVGKASIWAYADVPQTVRGHAAGQIGGLSSADDVAHFADRMQHRIEQHAPGFANINRGFGSGVTDEPNETTSGVGSVRRRSRGILTLVRGAK